MIALAVTVNNEIRIYSVTTTTVEVNDGHRVNGPWMSADDSDDCHAFIGIDAEHVSYLYHDGYDNITSCDFSDARYELRIDGVHDHDAIVDFFGARVSA